MDQGRGQVGLKITSCQFWCNRNVLGSPCGPIHMSSFLKVKFDGDFFKFLVLSKLKPFYKSTLKNPVYLQYELIADCAALLSVIPIISLFRQPWHLNRVISTGCQSCHSCQTFPVAATSFSQALRSNSSVLGPRTRANCQKGRGKNGQDPVLTGGRRWPMAKKCKKYFRF